MASVVTGGVSATVTSCCVEGIGCAVVLICVSVEPHAEKETARSRERKDAKIRHFIDNPLFFCISTKQRLDGDEKMKHIQCVAGKYEIFEDITFMF